MVIFIKMSTKPELVKVMAVPESIPVDLRYVMNYCLNVDTESRFTAEEAARRLEGEALLMIVLILT